MWSLCFQNILFAGDVMLYVSLVHHPAEGLKERRFLFASLRGANPRLGCSAGTSRCLHPSPAPGLVRRRRRNKRWREGRLRADGCGHKNGSKAFGHSWAIIEESLLLLISQVRMLSFSFFSCLFLHLFQASGRSVSCPQPTLARVKPTSSHLHAAERSKQTVRRVDHQKFDTVPTRLIVQ